jgi:hypothetical protein
MLKPPTDTKVDQIICGTSGFDSWTTLSLLNSRMENWIASSRSTQDLDIIENNSRRLPGEVIVAKNLLKVLF